MKMLKIVRAVICVLALGLSIPVVPAGAANQDQTPQAIGQPDASAQMQKVVDVPAEIARAVEALNSAKADLDKAGGEWGGHKANALQHIDSALKEISLAEDWAHKHGSY
jgi:hypothetical protein